MVRLYENLARWKPELFECAGKFEIPCILPDKIPDVTGWIPFNFLKSGTYEGVGVHMFVDDYQIARLWNRPTQYIDMLKRAKCVLSPDFSIYTDTPQALNIYNHYRKHWIAAYWQRNNITVIPTICWGDEDSFEWCFDGEPVGAVVAVSSVGTQKRTEEKAAFLRGYDAMLERLKPSAVLFYGTVPDEARGDIVHIPPYYAEIKQRRVAGA